MHLHFDLEASLPGIYFKERMECLYNNYLFFFYVYGHFACIHECARALHLCLESMETR